MNSSHAERNWEVLPVLRRRTHRVSRRVISSSNQAAAGFAQAEPMQLHDCAHAHNEHVHTKASPGNIGHVLLHCGYVGVATKTEPTWR